MADRVLPGFGQTRCGRAVDEGDAALTQGTLNLRVFLEKHARFPMTAPSSAHTSSIQEFQMAISAAVKEDESPATRFAVDQLKSIIERIERLEEEKKAISEDIKDVYAESKGNGFDVKALRTIIRLRKQDPNERQEEESILETYMSALGML
jgi:uncharacterized protein (UPF0335 family)